MDHIVPLLSSIRWIVLLIGGTCAVFGLGNYISSDYGITTVDHNITNIPPRMFAMFTAIFAGYAASAWSKSDANHHRTLPATLTTLTHIPVGI